MTTLNAEDSSSPNLLSATALEQAQMELDRRRHQESTFTNPLQRSPEMKPFLKEFYRTVHTSAKKKFYKEERRQYPVVNKYYRKLCGRLVSFEDFWQRYEYRCNLNRILQEQQQHGQGREQIFQEDLKQAIPKRTSLFESNGVSPTDVKEGRLLFDGTSIAEAGKRSLEAQSLDPCHNTNVKGSSMNDCENLNQIDITHKMRDHIVPTASSDDCEPEKDSMMNDIVKAKSDCTDTRANQAFKRRKSRLANLVAAKKEFRKAQKANEHHNFKPVKETNQEIIDSSSCKLLETLESNRPEMVQKRKSDVQLQSRHILQSPSNLYWDENHAEGCSKENCECTACAVM